MIDLLTKHSLLLYFIIASIKLIDFLDVSGSSRWSDVAHFRPTLVGYVFFSGTLRPLSFK